MAAQVRQRPFGPIEADIGGISIGIGRCVFARKFCPGLEPGMKTATKFNPLLPRPIDL